MHYKVTVNDTFHFDLSSDILSEFDSVSVETGKFHILHENHSYNAEIISNDFLAKKYSVRINNTAYEIAIQNPLDILIKEMGFEADTTQQINAIKAPMPGLILEISVNVGQAVVKNDPMIILGAMKMENSFLSPRDGTIKAIHVKTGDAVDKGKLLIEFE